MCSCSPKPPSPSKNPTLQYTTPGFLPIFSPPPFRFVDRFCGPSHALAEKLFKIYSTAAFVRLGDVREELVLLCIRSVDAHGRCKMPKHLPSYFWPTELPDSPTASSPMSSSLPGSPVDNGGAEPSLKLQRQGICVSNSQ